MAPRTFDRLGVFEIERYHDTQCVTVSVAVWLDLNNSKPIKSYRGHKFRRSGVSQSDLFVTDGDPPMRATSLPSRYRCEITGKKFWVLVITGNY